MSSIPYDLTKIKGFIFDVDGVLSCNVISLYPDGDPMRTVCIKDGYAMQLAVKKGYQLAIITGAYTEAVVKRYERLGLKYIYTKSSIKVNDYNDFMQRSGLKPEEVVYVGDDIPDYEVMKLVGLPVAPPPAQSWESLRSAMGVDKKTEGRQVRFVLSRGIGQSDLPEDGRNRA